MNKSPMNYLITIAFGAILWIATAIFYGGTFSESLMLAESTPEEFLANFRIMLGVAAGLGILTCVYWYYYGGLDTTAGDLGKAKRIWWALFIFQIISAVGILFTLVFMNLTEGILTSSWLISFVLISLHTIIFFLLCTYMISPRNVKNIPLFR